MSWKIRIILSIVTLIVAVFFGAIGGFLGPRLPLHYWGGGILILAALFLPWKVLVWSQEELLKEMKGLEKAVLELSKKQPELTELIEEMEGRGSLKDDEVHTFSDRFLSVRNLSSEAEESLRESLFGGYRRARVVQLIALFIAGIGGSLIAYHLAKIWML